MSKVVVVTGGARGIGLGIAEVLTEHGWQAVICDINGAAAHEAARRLGGFCFGFDLGDLNAVEHSAREILETTGGVDALVNNAAVERIMPFADTDRDLWETLIAVNLLGSIALTHGLLATLKAHHGRIVNIASAAGRTGSAGEVVYSATKAGLLGFTRALARELAADQVTVNAVCPGATETPGWRDIAKGVPRALEAVQRATPLARPYDRIGRAEDVAYAVEYLVSPRAAWVTGQTLSVDGGLVIA